LAIITSLKILMMCEAHLFLPLEIESPRSQFSGSCAITIFYSLELLTD
jgi:hypothetical protein